MRVTYLSGEGPASFNLGPIVAPIIVYGADGASAYEVAVANGFDGTPAAWLESLRGGEGRGLAYLGNSFQLTEGQALTRFDTFTHTFVIGTTIVVALLKPKQDRIFSFAELADTVQAVNLYDIILSTQNGPPGDRGDDGDPGASAYELAVAAGFSGDMAAWLESLAGDRGDDGEPGASAYELAVAAGFSGDMAAWLASLAGDRGDDGDPGASAYELAVAAGFSGDMAAWLASLAGDRGDDGEPGASAYELAVAAGFSGDMAAWLESLKGEAGASMTLTVVTTQAEFDSAVATPTNWIVRVA